MKPVICKPWHWNLGIGIRVGSDIQFFFFFFFGFTPSKVEQQQRGMELYEKEACKKIIEYRKSV